MSYLGSTPISQNFIAGTDYFNGTGSQTAFTLSRFVNTTDDIQVLVNNVVQIPSGYTVSGQTLTFSVAPSVGTSNVYARYMSTTLQSLSVPAGSTQAINITGNAATVTTNANLTGDVTSVGNASTLANTAVTAGSYTATSLTVDSKGRITAASNGVAGSTIVTARQLQSGTTYTAPSGLKALRVFVVGSTGAWQKTASSIAALGGNGGNGYSEKYFASPAATYSYAVGAGGTGNGGAGGTTTFNSCSVTGASGVAQTTTGAAGGVGSGGDFNATGGTGGNAGGTGNYSGGGGGAAGSRAGNGFNGATGVAGGGGGGGTGSAGSGTTPGSAKTTLSATAISGWDVSAPFTFEAGSLGSTAGTSCCGPATYMGGNGAGGSEFTGYDIRYPYSNNAPGGSGNYSNLLQRANGSPGIIVVWEYT